MSLIQRVTALAQAVAADIKALYAGKAEKEHTHTAAQVSGLGTAATEPSSLTGALKAGVAGRVEFNSAGLGTAVQINTPGRPGGWLADLMRVQMPTQKLTLGVYGTGDRGIRAYLGMGDYATQYNLNLFENKLPMVGPYAIRHSGDTLSLGATKTAALTTLNLTQQEKAIKDPSGLWVEQGALTNDMSSYLSSKTYAEMRAKLGVVPVEVVQESGTSSEAVMSQKAVTDAIAAGGGSVNVVQRDGFSVSAVMSQYAVTGFFYEMSTMSNISYLYDMEQHAAIHALDPETATLPQLIEALQSATLMDYEFEMPPPEP